ncbi:MAG: cyclic nucleotide-binding domain-containing protein [Anaerolineaceae bacterium]|nr:cyclic nucleotide-binding domain-containing protein [Anaerolineaceae bacterium]
MKKLAGIASQCQIKTNEQLFLEGEKEDYLYVVLEGQLAVEIHVPNKGWVRIFTAEPLDIVGWSSMTPVVRQRTASARALLPTRLVSLHAESLHKLCDEDHDLGYMIMKRVANVAASRLLTTRLQLLEMFANPEYVPQTDTALD